MTDINIEENSVPVNKAFSQTNPYLQLVWDATSLGTFKEWEDEKGQRDRHR